MDGKRIRERLGFADINIGDGADVRTRWTDPERRAQSCERRRLSSRGNLHISRRKVGHPSTEAESARFFAHEPAEANALNTAADSHAHPCGPLYCSHP